MPFLNSTSATPYRWPVATGVKLRLYGSSLFMLVSKTARAHVTGFTWIWALWWNRTTINSQSKANQESLLHRIFHLFRDQGSASVYLYAEPTSHCHSYKRCDPLGLQSDTDQGLRILGQCNHMKDKLLRLHHPRECLSKAEDLPYESLKFETNFRWYRCESDYSLESSSCKSSTDLISISMIKRTINKLCIWMHTLNFEHVILKMTNESVQITKRLVGIYATVMISIINCTSFLIVKLHKDCMTIFVHASVCDHVVWRLF